jgi:arylsulfatase A-like enzyme
MMRLFVWLICLRCLSCALTASADDRAATSRPNVLFIAIDDLNNWVGFLGGHPQVKTPNLDRLAKRAVIFGDAHCAAPLCNPSRAAIFSGLQPWESGVLNNDDSDIRKVRPDRVLLPTYFRKQGYATFGTGKLLHQKGNGLFEDEFYPEQRWSPFQPKQVNYTADEVASKLTGHPRHVTTLGDQQIVLPLNRLPSDRNPDSPAAESFDWGPLDVADEQMGDGQIARWAAKRLQQSHDRPFFMGVGFYRPHIPLFAPRKYFEMYDGEKLMLPPIRENDLDDLSETGRRWALDPVTAGAHETVVRTHQWKAAVHAYLACVSFIDAQIGVMLDALESGPAAKNTIVVVWGDHGWHLGEKQHWGKWTGWDRATRVPLLIAPATGDEGLVVPARSNEPVSLLDLYPTLIQLTGLPPRDDLSGKSLVPAMRTPTTATGRTVICTFGAGNHAVIDSRWRYIRYADGNEELYDRVSDPNEWTNLVARPEHKERIQQLSRFLPESSRR